MLLESCKLINQSNEPRESKTRSSLVVSKTNRATNGGVGKGGVPWRGHAPWVSAGAQNPRVYGA